MLAVRTALGGVDSCQFSPAGLMCYKTVRSASSGRALCLKTRLPQ